MLLLLRCPLGGCGGGQAASSYVYDGHGRRVRDIVGSSAYHFYDRNGRQMFGTNGRTNLHTQYVYLGGRLIATRERTSGTDTHTVKYQHTDALGSPVAVTNATRAVIERTEHEPDLLDFFGPLIIGERLRW
ncbi:MAG: hypothetical protein Q4F49_07560, partial [Pseudoxanthomonas suwonensis]|nr:hypothetical protein [Pseudoxanthomonas suwonensis]